MSDNNNVPGKLKGILASMGNERKISAGTPAEDLNPFGFEEEVLSSNPFEFDEGEGKAVAEEVLAPAPESAVDEGFLSRTFSLSGPSAFEIVSPFTDKLGQNIGDAGRNRLEKIKESLQRGKEGGLLQGQTPFETAGQVVAETGSGIIDTGMEFLQAITPDVINETAQRVGKAFDLKQYLPESAQEAIGFAGDIKDELGIQTTFELVDTGIEKWQRYEQTNPREAADVKAGLFLLEALLGVKGGKKAVTAGVDAGPAIKQGISDVAELRAEIGQAIREVPQQFAKKVQEFKITNQVDNVSEIEATSIASEVLRKAREEQVLPSGAETAAGISPATKKRIQGKGDQLQRFTDQAQAGLLDDTVDPPLTLAVQDADKAVKKVRKGLNEAGSEIGGFREKTITTKVPIQEIQGTIDSFDAKLESVGLVIGKNRRIKVAKGRTPALSQADIKKLQEFRDDLITLKGDPSLRRIIDVRNKVQNEIKFGKRANVLTDAVDAFGKDVRSSLAKINAKAIGPEQAKFLKQYSDMLDFLDEWDRATSKGKSTETLLKRVFSERPRKAKELFDFIRDHTGIDISDSVAFAQIATDFLGDPRMTGLFQQEITKAGVIAANAVTGGKAGLFKSGLEVGKAFLDRRKGLVPDLERAKKAAETLLEASGGRKAKKGGLAPKKEGATKAPEASAIPKEIEPLEVEAKQFKSAEEFVKAKSELRDKNFLERGKILGFKGEDEKLLNRIQEALDTLKRDGDRATFKNAQELVDVEDISKGILDTSERIDDLIARINRSTAKATNTEDIITKQQLTDIWNKANKTDSSPLEAEAKKFKSAEEFVNNNQLVFRGDMVEGLPNTDIISVTPSKDQALGFAQVRKGGDKVSEFYLAPNAKIKDINMKFGQELRGTIMQARDEGFDAVRYIEDGILSNDPAKTIAITNKNIIKTKQQLTDIWNKANKTDSSPLEAEAKKFKSAEEFVKKEAIRKQLIEDGTMINADDTVTLYHATLPERLEKIKKQGFVRGGAEATGGMTGLDLQPSAFFGTDKRWVEETWGGKARHVLEVKVPLEHIRKPAQNTLEVYFEGGLKRQGDIWVPAQPVRSTFYDRIAEKGLINKQQLTDIWNKANNK